MNSLVTRVLRTNWDPTADSLSENHGTYLLSLSDRDWKRLMEIFENEKYFYTLTDGEEMKTEEKCGDLNKDLVMAFFGLDICYS